MRSFSKASRASASRRSGSRALSTRERRGLRVLTSRPSEAERGLAHAGLGDLFEDVLDDVLPSLAPPRRRALEVALLVEDAPEDPVDHRALAVAVRGALEALSEREPVVVAVDDVQWLDPSSARALAFALRRLGEKNVRVLLARRLVAGAEASELESALPPERVEIGPLSVGAVHRLLRDRLGRSFARQTLLRIHEQSGGNPFFALEIARALDGEVDPLEPLPVPPTLDGLVRVRLTGLPPTTRDALGLASAIGTPSEVLLEQAGVPEGALDPALAATRRRARRTGRSASRIRCCRRRSTTTSGTSARAFTLALQSLVDDPVVRARHLALSSDEPDADIATTLDEAAIIAADRGASAERCRARRAGPAADARNRGRRARSSSAGRGSCASGRGRMDARANHCDLACRGRTRAAARRSAHRSGRARVDRRFDRIARGGPPGGRVEPPAAGGHPDPARLGDPLPRGVRQGPPTRRRRARARRASRR